MAYRDLREFVADLERRGWLRRVAAEVDPELEITEITDRVVKAGGPALLFERVHGSDMPVLINAFGGRERMELALGGRPLDEIGAEIRGLLEPPPLGSALDKLRALPKLAELANIFPRTVRSGPCQEVVETGADVDLTRLPVLKCWPGDGGRFITLPLVFTRDPATGKRNAGMYRMQVYDRNTTGMHWQKHKHGAHHMGVVPGGGRLEVAVALGGDPATIYAATAPLPKDVDEMVFAGFLRKQPVEMVRCRTVDLEVPAHAEIVLEGYVDAVERRVEGPFGDHTGVYSLEEEYPVFHVTAVTRRRNAIYPTIVVGKPPMEDTFLGKATERIFLPLIQLMIPEIADLSFPDAGVFHNAVVISIRKTYPGQARKVMSAVWGLGQLMFTKLVIVVDDDTDPHDEARVWWKVMSNVDWRRDVMVVDGPVDALDHSAPRPLVGAKMGIDATRKGPDEGHPRRWPDEIEMDPAVRALVDRRWREYGL